MFLVRTAAAACLIALAACQAQTMPDGSTRLSFSPANLIQPSTAVGYGQAGPTMPPAGNSASLDPALVHRVALRFVHDFRNGMAGVVIDDRRCYASAMHGRIDRAALRECIALDIAAKRRDDLNTHRFGVPNMDFLTDAAVLDRINHEGPLVFSTEAETLAFMRGTGNAVYIESAQMLARQQ